MKFLQAMEVYEFQNGEKVVRQGDTDGAHKQSKIRANAQLTPLPGAVVECHPFQKFQVPTSLWWHRESSVS